MSGKFCTTLLCLAALTSTSCVTHEATQINAPKSTQDRIGNAVVSPLNDFNLMQSDIPAVLIDAVSNPYLVPHDGSCKGIIEQVQLLDTALGPDLDALTESKTKTDLEKGGDFAENEAVGSVERTIQGVIPFRSWIRRLSGAEKRSKEFSTAVAAGVVRRAFLKGMGQERGCDAPAAPLRRPLSPSDQPAIQK